MSSLKRKKLFVKALRLALSFYKPAVYRPILFATFLLSLISCTKDSNDNDDIALNTNTPATAPQLSSPQDNATYDGSGNVVINFNLPEEKQAIQLIASAPGATIRLVRLKDNFGNIIFDADSAASSTMDAAGRFQASPNTYNYPTSPTAAALAPGNYSAYYQTKVNSSPTNVPLTLELASKTSRPSQTSTINLNVIYSGVVANSNESRNGVKSALNLAQTMLADYGVLLYFDEITLPELPELLPNPVNGDILYEELSFAADGQIPLYIASDIDNFNGGSYVSAISGSSPGPVIPSTRSAIAVSVSLAGGSDGRIDGGKSNSGNQDNTDDSETRLLAENIAHEILKYAGVPDTMQFSGNRVVLSDGLDSEKCPTLDACQDNKGANGNIMFPFPLRMDNSSGNQKYFPRNRLSTQQLQVLQHYVGIE